MGEIQMTVREILQKEALFQNKDVSFRQLEGGLVNQSYRVSDANREYYLRIHSTQGDYLGLDRRLEEETCKAAGRLGISPAVYKNGYGNSRCRCRRNSGKSSTGWKGFVTSGALTKSTAMCFVTTTYGKTICCTMEK